MFDLSGAQSLHDLIQQELQKSTERTLSLILENCGQGVLFINDKGTITQFNSLACSLLNCSNPKNFELSDDFFGFSLKEALRLGLIRKIFYRTIHKKDLEITTVKADFGLILFLRDCTKQESLRQQSQRSELMKELGELAATAAHEIRNSLGGIRGYASLLHRDLEQFPHLQQIATTLLEGVRSLETLAIGILHFARPVAIQTQSIELGSFLKQLGAFVRIDPAFPKNISLEIHIPKETLLVPLDPNAFKPSLLNLIRNSYQAMPQGGTITVSLLRQDPQVLIMISDTGAGISEEDQRLLFSPFFTTKQKGTGLGLVEARKVIQAHGGTLEVRSQPGKGTTVSLRLPVRRL